MYININLWLENTMLLHCHKLDHKPPIIIIIITVIHHSIVLWIKVKMNESQFDGAHLETPWPMLLEIRYLKCLIPSAYCTYMMAVSVLLIIPRPVTLITLKWLFVCFFKHWKWESRRENFSNMAQTRTWIQMSADTGHHCIKTRRVMGKNVRLC